MTDQEIDLDKFTLTDEDLAKAALPPTKEQRTAKRRQEGYFTTVPWAWKKALQMARSVAAYQLALHLLHVYFETKHKTFKVTNQMAAEAGLSRYQKTHALADMASWGIIAVEWRGKRSPIVTLMVPPLPSRRKKKA